jgi:uncharacterized protein with WD repeat
MDVNSDEDDVASNKIHSDKNVNWSPKGTFLIAIKHDKVDFYGG